MNTPILSIQKKMEMLIDVHACCALCTSRLPGKTVPRIKRIIVFLTFLALSFHSRADNISSLETLDRPILRPAPLPPKGDTNIDLLVFRANTNDAKAQCSLGLHYVHGIIVPPDSTNAVKWLSKSAEQGFPPAEYTLGILFKYGLGVSTNGAIADQWFQKASDQGYAPAKHEAALIADRKGNRAEALNLLRDAAEHRFPSSQYLMGCIVSDPIEKYFWFSLSSDNIEFSRTRLLELRRTLTKEQIFEGDGRIRSFLNASGTTSTIKH